MYLVVLNQERRRGTCENMVMVRIIPGPNEPSFDVNGKYINVTVRPALAELCESMWI